MKQNCHQFHTPQPLACCSTADLQTEEGLFGRSLVLLQAVQKWSNDKCVTGFMFQYASWGLLCPTDMGTDINNIECNYIKYSYVNCCKTSSN